MQPLPLAKGSPGAWRQKSPVAWIAQFLNLVNPLFRVWLAIRHAAVDEKEVATGLQNPGHLTNEGLPIAEMMRSHPAGYEIE